MEQESSINPDIEPTEKFGRDVEIHAFFIRHGEKEPSATTGETDLTDKGRLESRAFGQRLELRTAIKPYTSDTARTTETARLITEASPTEKKMQLQIKGELGFQYSQNFIGEVRRKQQAAGEDKADEVVTDWFLSFEDKNPDMGTFSPIETAAMIARRIDIYSRMADRLNSGSNVDLVNISHDFPIAAFLKEILVRDIDGKSVKGFSSIAEIGGPIGYNDGFEVLIHNDQVGQKQISLNLRGETCQLDQARFNELVEFARTREKEEI